MEVLHASRKLRRYHASIEGLRLTLVVSPHQVRDETLGIVWIGNDEEGIDHEYSLTKLGDPHAAHDELLGQFQSIVEDTARVFGLRVSPEVWHVGHDVEPRLAAGTVEDLFRATVEGCRKHVLELGDLPWIQYALFPRRGEGLPIALVAGAATPYEKQVLGGMVNLVGNQHSFIGWVNAATAWLAPATPLKRSDAPETIDEAPVAPSQHPDRQEILWVAGTELNGSVLNEAWRIHRQGERVVNMENLGAIFGDEPLQGQIVPRFTWAGHEAYRPVVSR